MCFVGKVFGFIFRYDGRMYVRSCFIHVQYRPGHGARAVVLQPLHSGFGPLLHMVRVVGIEFFRKRADQAGGVSCIASDFASAGLVCGEIIERLAVAHQLLVEV